jgi:hypothetical protein
MIIRQRRTDPVTKTGCFILSALWTKLGLLQGLTNGQPTSSQARWAGHQERENVYLRPEQQSRVVLAPAVRKRTRFRQKLKRSKRHPGSIALARDTLTSSSLTKSAESIMSLVWKPRGQLGAKDDHAVVQLRIRIDDDKPCEHTVCQGSDVQSRRGTGVSSAWQRTMNEATFVR